MADRGKGRFPFRGWLVSIILTLLLAEAAFRVTLFREGAMYHSIHHGLTSSVTGYLSKPYLNYINNPGLHNSRGEYQINGMGIRYPRDVDMPKPDSTYRILFLGGSTTFGDVDDEYPMFSAIIEDSLRPVISTLEPRFTDVECLNAGAHAHTSAEMLTHYQFRHRYLTPDLIVLHTGANDAFCYCEVNGAVYQPDYHNCRKVFRDMPTMGATELLLMHSRAMAFVIIRLKFSDYLETTFESNPFFRFQQGEPWYPAGADSLAAPGHNAFYNNLRALLALSGIDGAGVLMVPEVIDPAFMPSPFDSILPRGLSLHTAFMRSLADTFAHADICLLPNEEFTPDIFIPNDDGLHVSGRGEELKARHMLRAIVARVTAGKESAE